MDPSFIARIAYDACRSHAIIQGDGTRPEWFKLDAWQRTALIHQVKVSIAFPDFTPRELHGLFLAERREQGWKFAPRFDLALKRDPLFVEWDNLSAFQRRQDELALAVIRFFSAGER